MIRVRKLIVGQLQTNCYLVIDEKTHEALIVDPGDDADYVQRIISDEGVKPTKIIATHGHYDHILAVTELKLAYQIPFLMHKDDEFLLKRMRTSAAHFGKIAVDPPPKVDRYLKEGEKLVVGHLSFEVIHTPGHTPGSVSLYNREAKAVFVGDLVFAEGFGRTDFLYSNPKHLKESIKKITQLPKGVIVYSGHQEETTVGDIIMPGG